MPGALTRWLPGLAVARSYQRPWLTSDIVAGLVLTAVLVPVGMGYAEAAGLPAITGLYASIAPLLLYALFGPSRVLVLGPDSALAPLIAATIAPLAAGDPDRATTLAAGLAIITGAFGIAFGLLRLGLVTDLLSMPIRVGFLIGIAVEVFIGQLPKLFGFSADGEGSVDSLRAFVAGVLAGETNVAALTIGLGSIGLILGLRLVAPRIPGVLVVTVGSIILVALAGPTLADVPKVGAMPPGLPIPGLPHLSVDDWMAMLPGGLAIAVVAMADTSVLSRALAGRTGERVDQDQELVALGAATAGAGLISGLPVCASASRTPVALEAGARSPLAGVVGAIAITLLLVLAPGLTADLPASALAAIVITASFSLVDLPAFVRLWRLRRSEFVLALVSFAGVVLIGVIQGIFLAVALAVAAFVWTQWRPYSAVLGRVEGVKGYHDVTRYPDARRPDGLVLFRWDAPLFFANAGIFFDAVQAAVTDAPTRTRWLVVAAEPMTDVDTTAADMLDELIDELAARSMELRFAELKDPVKDTLRRYGLLERIGTDAFYPTIGTAVDAYIAATGTDWVDWEERDLPSATASSEPGPSGGDDD